LFSSIIMIHIYCDGGLGNRLLTMFSGLFFSKATNKPFVIHWPVNNWCGCNLGDIYDNKYEITSLSLKGVSQIIPANCIFLIHSFRGSIKRLSRKKSKAVVINVELSKSKMLELFNMSSDILYCGDNLHRSLEINDIRVIVNELAMSENVRKCISQYDLNGFHGIHIRGTDSPLKPYYTIPQLEDEVRNNIDKKYFVCSDQKDIEILFKKYSNVVIFDKSNYVKKIDLSKRWGIKVHNGRQFNIDRNRLSVIEAFCDMMLLSKTEIIKTSESSFLRCAELFSKSLNSARMEGK